MKFNHIGVLTSRQSWFVLHAKKFVSYLKENGFDAKLFFSHKKISSKYEVVFILSYFNKIEMKYLGRHKHNLVVHASGLPRGKGWAPLFWQILEGKNKIPIVLFEANETIDGGIIYLKDNMIFNGDELYEEIRAKQAEKTKQLCGRFLEVYPSLRKYVQKGKSTFYRRRTPQDSNLDINKSLKSQINLLRIVDNHNFPAFFEYKGHKYILKIFKNHE